MRGEVGALRAGGKLGVKNSESSGNGLSQISLSTVCDANFMERETRFEPATFTLEGLLWHFRSVLLSLRDAALTGFASLGVRSS